MARRLHSSGNIGDLELARENAHFEQTRLELAASETALLDTREQLTRSMGLWGSQVNWRLPEKLPDISAEEMPLEHLESAAIENRLRDQELKFRERSNLVFPNRGYFVDFEGPFLHFFYQFC